MTDDELLKRWPVLPPDSLLVKMSPEEKYRAEAMELIRLEAMDTTEMPDKVRIWHQTAIGDVYWRRRMFGRK
jgi:hypothetical protein